MCERKQCDCGPNDMCTDCTIPAEFWAAFMAALRAQIHDDEVPGA